jgi:hypothetical protein
MANLYIPTKEDLVLFEKNILRKIDEKIDSRFSTNIKIYTSADLQNFLKITANTVVKYRSEGLSFIRINNGEYRYTHDDIVEFINNNRYNHLKKFVKAEKQ